MRASRRHAHIHLPPLDAGYALTLVDIFERAIEAIWRAHGERMAELCHFRAARHPLRSPAPAHDIDPAAPDVDSRVAVLSYPSALSWPRTPARFSAPRPSCPLRRQFGRRPSCRRTLAAPTALAASIRPSSATTAPSNYSDVSSAIAPISYDLNSAIR
jgi:hypothetical protein